MWMYLGIISAVFLGFYDIGRKHALQKNAVLPVLFLSTVFGALLMVPAIILSRFVPASMETLGVYIPAIPLISHLHLFAKAVIVSASWVLSYFALKHLPISIVSAIGSSVPVWTLLGAILLFREQPTSLQYLGLAVMTASYYVFSKIGSKEGIMFHSNKWVIFVLLATLIITLSALYDKFLIQSLGYAPIVVQAWYSIYLVPVLGLVLLVFWFPGRNRYTPFAWRWSIPLIGFFLIISDFIYFKALNYKGALIAMLIALRCSYVVVSFFGGAAFFNEVRISAKAVALAGVLGGVFLILFSK